MGGSFQIEPTDGKLVAQGALGSTGWGCGVRAQGGGMGGLPGDDEQVYPGRWLAVTLGISRQQADWLIVVVLHHLQEYDVNSFHNRRDVNQTSAKSGFLHVGETLHLVLLVWF